MIRRLAAFASLAIVVAAAAPQVARAQESVVKKQMQLVDEKLQYKDFDGARERLAEAKGALDKVSYATKKDELTKKCAALEAKLDGAESSYNRDEAMKLITRAQEALGASDADPAQTAKRKAEAKRNLERAAEYAAKIKDAQMKKSVSSQVAAFQKLMAAEEKALAEAAKRQVEQERTQAAKAEEERKAAELAKRLADEEVARRQAEERAAKSESEKAAAVEARKKAEEEAAKAQERQRVAEEAAKREQEERLAAERAEAERKAAAEAAAKKAAEEAALRKAEEERLAADAAKKQAEEEAAKRAAEEEAARKAAQAAKDAEEKKRAEEELAAAEAARKQADEEKRKAEEEKKKLEAQHQEQPTSMPAGQETGANGGGAANPLRAELDAKAEALWRPWVDGWKGEKKPLDLEAALAEWEKDPMSVQGQWVSGKVVGSVGFESEPGLASAAQCGSHVVLVKLDAGTRELRDEAVKNIRAKGDALAGIGLGGLEFVGKVHSTATLKGANGEERYAFIVVYALKESLAATIPGVGVSTDQVEGVEKVKSKFAVEGEFKK